MPRKVVNSIIPHLRMSNFDILFWESKCFRVKVSLLTLKVKIIDQLFIENFSSLVDSDAQFYSLINKPIIF